ncbi:MAG: T9SS type A sorting domain-containing protein [Reichenbachiella sp.]
MKKSTLTLIALVCSVFSTYAQDCNCDFTLNPTENQIIFNGKNEGVQPGNIVCLTAGTYRKLIIEDVEGTKEKPVIFQNCGGLVEFEPTSEGIDSRSTHDIWITGTGDKDLFYGISISGKPGGGGIGIRMGFFTNNYHIDHVKIEDVKTHGMNLKNDPKCDDPRTWRESGNVNDYVIVHDNYINNTGQEGFYIGDSHYHHEELTCLGGGENEGRLVQESPILKAEVYNNIVENTGRDGIQVGSVIEEAIIHDNHVRNSGLGGNESHLSGFQINPGTKGILYNNIVINTPGTAYFILGDGVEMHHNLAYKAETAIEGYERLTHDTSTYIIHNNTFLEIFGYGISFSIASFTKPSNIYSNNIIHYIKNDNIETYNDVYQYQGKPWEEKNEQNFIHTTDISSLNLRDIANEDFGLTKDSQLSIDLGDCSINEAILYDLEGFDSSFGSSCDIGALEYTTPSITFDKKQLDFGVFGNLSEVNTPDQSYTISSSNIRGFIKIPVPDHFQLSTEAEIFTDNDTLVLGSESSRFINTEIFVRYNPSAPGIATTKLLHLSDEAEEFGIELIAEIVLETEKTPNLGTTIIYPNPIDSGKNRLLNISLSQEPSDKTSISIVDIAGKEYLRYHPKKINSPLLLPNSMHAGLYYIKIAYSNYEVITKKILLN